MNQHPTPTQLANRKANQLQVDLINLKTQQALLATERQRIKDLELLVQDAERMSLIEMRLNFTKKPEDRKFTKQKFLIVAQTELAKAQKLRFKNTKKSKSKSPKRRKSKSPKRRNKSKSPKRRKS